MLSKIYLAHKSAQEEKGAELTKVRKEFDAAVEDVGKMMVGTVNEELEQIYGNQSILETEAKQLQLQASKISKKTKQWVSSSEQFKRNLQQVGSIESWVASVDKDLNLIATIMKSIYAPPKYP